MLTILRRLWAGWLRIAHIIGTFQARILLSVFYFVVVPAFAVLVKLLRDPLAVRGGATATFWVDRPELPLDAGRRQY
jgi:hypothetical protein